MIDLSSELMAWFCSDEVQARLQKLMRAAVKSEISELLDGELLDVAGAAKILSMTEGAVRKAAERDQIPSLRLGRRVRFRRAELLRIAPTRASAIY